MRSLPIKNFLWGTLLVVQMFSRLRGVFFVKGFKFDTEI